jgi:hypothetical protein
MRADKNSLFKRSRPVSRLPPQNALVSNCQDDTSQLVTGIIRHTQNIAETNTKRGTKNLDKRLSAANLIKPARIKVASKRTENHIDQIKLLERTCS